jgi:hypothetical protein
MTFSLFFDGFIEDMREHIQNKESKINGWLCEFFPILLTHTSRIERKSIKQSKKD